MRPGGGVGLGQLAREAAEDVRFGAGSGRRNFFLGELSREAEAIWRPKERKRGPAGSVGLTLGPGRVRIQVQNRVDFEGSARPPESFRLSWLGTLDTLGPSSLRRQARGCVRAFCCAQVKLTSPLVPLRDGSHVGGPFRHREATAEGSFPAFPRPPSVCSAACRALCAVAGRCAVCPAACVRPAGRQRVCGGVPPGGWPPGGHPDPGAGPRVPGS